MIYYLTHPEVVIDPQVDVKRWGLTDKGQARSRVAASAPWTAILTNVVSSDEAKAMECAAVIATARELPHVVAPEQGEIDRSASGFIPEPEFSQVAEACFKTPGLSVRGWEPARAAQARVVAGLETHIQSRAADAVTLVVGHGGVGAFLYAFWAGVEINAPGTKPGGFGRVFAYDPAAARIVLGWGDMETGPSRFEVL